MTLAIGDRAPDFLGAALNGVSWSLEPLAGRPTVLLALGGVEPQAAAAAFARLSAAKATLEAEAIQALALAPMIATLSRALGADPLANEAVAYLPAGCGLETLAIDGEAAAVLIDRSGRIVDIAPFTTAEDLIARWRATASHAANKAATAPVLLIPNVASRDFCERVIAHFEASEHSAGVMASFAGGAAYAKLDEAKKHRREMVLEPDHPLHAEIVDIFARRCAPEVKRAFQAELTAVDRIVIARYDDTGGYFRRHRDDAAPHVAFREFAISLNLNTDAYEGGEILFPEYADHRYSPPAGGAVIFSASLLHEAAPVTRGGRYVVLSFLSTAAGQARAARAMESAAAEAAATNR